MKYLYLLPFLLCLNASQAQIINFPDANLKAILLVSNYNNTIASSTSASNHKIDMNDDGEIQVSEALSIIRLNINDAQLTDLTGIEYFVNLIELNCFNNNLTTFNDAGLHLQNLEMANNQLTSINLSSSAAVLSHVQLSDNNLTSFELNSTAPIIGMLYLANNPLTALQISGNYDSITVGATLLSTLDLSNCTASTVVFDNCANLHSINIKNGHIEQQLTGFPSVPNLQYICADDAEIENLTVPSDIEVNSYCSFTPGGEFYAISGINTFDANANGCDDADAVLPHLKFSISGDSASGSFISNASGSFSIPVQQGTHTITPIFENPSYFTVSPTSVTVAFPDSPSPFTQNFCVVPNGVHHDVNIFAMPIGPAVPGFDAEYGITVTNVGTQVESGFVSFLYDDLVLDFVSAGIGTVTNSPGQVNITFDNLQPFESHFFSVTVNLNSPMETPALIQDDILTFGASVTITAADEAPSNNSQYIQQTVVNSMDPNHKTCAEGVTIPPSMVGDYVRYVIEFENLGTFPATNVIVKDRIDTTKFDIMTLIPVNSSHIFVTKISDTNKVEFIFEGINLPFDDANNDGYIAFKIKTKPTLVVGNTFSNTASIYFDYNFPIITNTETTTISALANPDFEFSRYFSVYPNPASQTLNIESKQGSELQSISIFNMIGQQVIVIPNAKDINSIDVSSLQSGTYFMKISSEKGSSSTKFIKN